MPSGYDLFLYEDGRRLGSVNKFVDGYPTIEAAEESRKDWLRGFARSAPDIRIEPIADADAEKDRRQCESAIAN